MSILSPIFDYLRVNWLPIVALIISVISYTHTKKVFRETVEKPFTLKVLPKTEITFWQGNNHFGDISFEVTFYNAGNEPGVVTDLYLVRLDNSMSNIIHKMQVAEYTSNRKTEVGGYKAQQNLAFAGIRLGPKKEKHERLLFKGDRQEFFSKVKPDIYLAYRTLEDNKLRLANVIIRCSTDLKFFDELERQSRSVPVSVSTNRYNKKIVVDPN